MVSCFSVAYTSHTYIYIRINVNDEKKKKAKTRTKIFYIVIVVDVMHLNSVGILHTHINDKIYILKDLLKEDEGGKQVTKT